MSEPVPFVSRHQGRQDAANNRSIELLSCQSSTEHASRLGGAVPLATAQLKGVDIDEVLWTGSNSGADSTLWSCVGPPRLREKQHKI